MNKNIKRFLQGLLFILIIVAFIYIGAQDFSTKVIVDNEKFDQEYQNVSKDNVFHYVNAGDVYSILRSGTAIIFMGFKENSWSGYYANILNETAKQSGIKEILYYDFNDDRKMKNATYQSIVLKLSEYLPTLDDGTKNIYAPTLIIVDNGTVKLFDSDTSINIGNITPKEYWDDSRIGIKMTYLKQKFIEHLQYLDSKNKAK